jgi:peptide/nickel transport system permease protein
MTKYVLRRLTQVAPTIVGIICASFILVRLAPGDPIDVLASGNGDEAYYEFMRTKYQLDEPLVTQLWAYFSNVLRGDFGTSYLTGEPVVHMIIPRIGSTVLLTLSSIFVSTIIGVMCGLLAAWRVDQTVDRVVLRLSTLAIAAPSFWIAQMMLLLFALRLGIFPSDGRNSPGFSGSGMARTIDTIWHLILPMTVLAIQESSTIARLTRIGIVDLLDEDHIRLARAKGLSDLQVISRHALRGSLRSVVTVIGGRVGHVFSGAVVVELIFGWPGLGQLVLSSSQAQDTPVLMGVLILVAAAVVVTNLATDLTYMVIDPRVRLR